MLEVLTSCCADGHVIVLEYFMEKQDIWNIDLSLVVETSIVVNTFTNGHFTAIQYFFQFFPLLEYLQSSPEVSKLCYDALENKINFTFILFTDIRHDLTSYMQQLSFRNTAISNIFTFDRYYSYGSIGKMFVLCLYCYCYSFSFYVIICKATASF